MTNFRILAGLPPLGDLAVSFPPDWGKLAREGLVVEFVGDDEVTWVGNFRPGIGGLEGVRQHPNGKNVLVISSGDTWVVNPTTREATEIAGAVDALWTVSDPEGVVLSLQGLALLRISSEGIVWQTRRISWDGFAEVEVSSAEVTGVAWSPFSEAWVPFVVNLRTGQASGGSYLEPDAIEGERLVTQRPG